jgi:hypothetical protein
VAGLPRGLAPAALAALALGACGGSGDEGAVKDTVNDLYAGFAEKDAGKVCDTLSREQRDAVARGGAARASGRSCAQVMGAALSYVGDALEDADEAKVTKVEVDGDRATATVEFKGRSSELGLAKEEGGWKVSDYDLRKL